MPILLLNNEIYPCWRHHVNGASKIIESKAEDEALGPEWADTPLAFELLADADLTEPKAPAEPGDEPPAPASSVFAPVPAPAPKAKAGRKRAVKP